LRLGIPRFGISRLWTVRIRVFDHCGVGLWIFNCGVLGFGVLGFGVVKRHRGGVGGRGRDLTKASGIPLVALTPVAAYPVYTGTSILAGVPQALIDIGATVDPAEPGWTPAGVGVDAICAHSVIQAGVLSTALINIDLAVGSSEPWAAIAGKGVHTIHAITSVLTGLIQAVVDVNPAPSSRKSGRTSTGVGVDAIYALSTVFTTGGLAVVDVLSAGVSCPALLALTNRRQVFVPAGAVSAVDVFAVVNLPTTPSSFKARRTLAFKSGPVVHTGRSVAAGHGRASITLGVQADEARLAYITIIPGCLGVSR
jgi:hypothetical protein